ncbi:hypothetical protein D2E70_25350 [Mycobacteroides abscessus]|nr:hypothetical protein D2E70_25350 [Mycobacteroides abscessus]
MNGDTMSGDGAKTTTGEEPKGRGAVEPTWRIVLDIAWRVLLVVVGIPAVWILKHYNVGHLTTWQAAGISIMLFCIAVGEYALAALW